MVKIELFEKKEFSINFRTLFLMDLHYKTSRLVLGKAGIISLYLLRFISLYLSRYIMGEGV